MRTGATFDHGRRYRYALWRLWNRARPEIAFVMLNPNLADATRDDPTIRRCIGFARDWGYGGLRVVNLFALCARHPAALRRAGDPIGPRNDRFVLRAAARAERVVAAWGVHGTLCDRDREVLDALRGAGVVPLCLGVTRDGHPRHPLYLRRTTGLSPLRT